MSAAHRIGAVLALSVTLGATSAAAAEPTGPYLWTRAQLGAGGAPLGLLGDVRMQVRAPIWHSDSFLLQDNYVGAGLRVAASPAFVEGGPRLSIAPVAFFDLDVQGSVHRYFDDGLGFLPYDSTSGKLESERDARAADSFGSTAWTLTATPTLKAQLGPVIVLDSVAIEAWHVEMPSGMTAPYVYEPFRDLVIGWDDVVIEHQPAIILTPWKGDDNKRKLWIGATMRDRYALVSHDRSMAVGGMAIFRPGSRSAAMPTLVVQVLPYVIDADRVGGVPNIQGAWVWKMENPFKPTGELH